MGKVLIFGFLVVEELGPLGRVVNDFSDFVLVNSVLAGLTLLEETRSDKKVCTLVKEGPSR